jgi:DNA repair ATPase RecN
LKRELDQLKKENQKLGGLQDLANKLGQVQKSLKEGDMEGAEKGLGQAADKLKGMEGNEEDLQDLRDQLARLQDAKDSC